MIYVWRLVKLTANLSVKINYRIRSFNLWIYVRINFGGKISYRN